MSTEFRSFLLGKGIAQSRTTPFNPAGNGQCERVNQTLWRTIKMMLHHCGKSEDQWERLLPDALHSIRSLLCTSTNCTPHEKFFQFSRRSTNGVSSPSWLLTPGPVLLRRHVQNKGDPLVDRVDLIEANPHYAYVRFDSGRESTVSVKDLAPCPTENTVEEDLWSPPSAATPCPPASDEPVVSEGPLSVSTGPGSPVPTDAPGIDVGHVNPPPIRPTRERRPPERYGFPPQPEEASSEATM